MSPFTKIAQITSINALLLTTTTVLAAQADQILVQPSRPTVIIPLPASIVDVVPGATSTTTTTTITAPAATIVAPETVVVPGSVVMPMTKRTVIMSLTPLKKESTTLLSLKIGPIPEFTTRLNLMHGQIQNGLSKGWLDNAEADALMSEHRRLDGMISVLRANYTQKNADDIEKGLNLLNIRVADSFQHNLRTAGADTVH